MIGNLEGDEKYLEIWKGMRNMGENGGIYDEFNGRILNFENIIYTALFYIVLMLC